jgi:hypothetical protein
MLRHQENIMRVTFKCEEARPLANIMGFVLGHFSDIPDDVAEELSSLFEQLRGIEGETTIDLTAKGKEAVIGCLNLVNSHLVVLFIHGVLSPEDEQPINSLYTKVAVAAAEEGDESGVRYCEENGVTYRSHAA